MGIYFGLVNFDEAFKQLKKEPIILNDIKFYSEEERETMIQKFLTQYSSDVISSLPQCECGELVGEYLVGQICPKCGTQVISSNETDIEPLFWLRRPQGVEKLVNPTIWTMLRENFKYKNMSLIDYLTDTLIPEPNGKVGIIDTLRENNIQRGYNFFIENFDLIINIILESKEYKKNTKKTLVYFRELLEHWKNSIFSDYIPVPHRSLLVMENVKGISKNDNTSGTSVEALEAFNLMAGIDKKLSEKSIVARMNRTSRALTKISQYYFNFYKSSLIPKHGIFRRHIFSTRSHFTFRAVITSLTGKHSYDELHLPWGLGVSLFQIHLLNKLMRNQYSYNEAKGIIFRSIKEYNPDIDKLLQELIYESPGHSISCLFNRNPTLLMSSIQKLRITKVKNNLNDNTIGISILLMPLYNGDFDGDEMNGILAIDNMVDNLWEPFKTYHNIHNLDKPYKITNHLTLSKPVVSMVSSWLMSNDD
jgi:hypothetical protein